MTEESPAGGIGAELWDVLRRHRWRIVAAVVLLLVAKLATVAVPLLLKRIIDAFSQPALPDRLPLYLLVAYALLRFSSTLFNELRDLLFVRVTLAAVSAYAQKTFSHLHALGPRFHARRKLGSLLPDIDRGTSGIAFLLGIGLFTIVPTLAEIGLVLAIMLDRYAAGFAGIILATFLVYAGFTLVFTARRVVYQRRVNKLDSTAKRRLADSLINYDTVKYFGGEAREAQRFAAIMGDWREAGAANQRALFTLHVGQSGIIALGVAAIMVLAPGAGRRQPGHRPGHHAGGGGPQRLRQVDAGAPAAALLRSGQWPDPGGRTGHPASARRQRARSDRRGAAGYRPVQRHDRQQHRLRPRREYV